MSRLIYAENSVCQKTYIIFIDNLQGGDGGHIKFSNRVISIFANFVHHKTTSIEDDMNFFFGDRIVCGSSKITSRNTNTDDVKDFVPTTVGHYKKIATPKCY